MKAISKEGVMTHRRLKSVIAVVAMIVCCVLTVTAAILLSEDEPPIQRAKVYDTKERSDVLFLFERRVGGAPDGRRAVVRFSTPAGKELVREEVNYQGVRFQTYAIDKFQTKERGEVSVRNGRIHFLYRDRSQQEKRKTETWDESVIVVDELPWFIQQNWKSLKAKKSVPFRFVVPERAETVGFELLVRGAGRCGGAPAALIQMRVRGGFARLFAPEIALTVSEQPPHEICEYVGPTKPYSADLKEVQGRTVFE
jgi:hypothetical protein